MFYYRHIRFHGIENSWMTYLAGVLHLVVEIFYDNPKCRSKIICSL